MMNDQGHQTSMEPSASTDTGDTLLEHTSFGTQAAQSLRDRAAPAAVDNILRRTAELAASTRRGEMPEQPAAGGDAITTAAELGQALKLLVRRGPGGPVKVTTLAQRLNLSQSTVYAYLAGTTVPPSDVLEQLLGELGAPPDERRRLSLARDALRRRRRGPTRSGTRHHLPSSLTPQECSTGSSLS
jgi:hypothetical protein